MNVAVTSNRKLKRIKIDIKSQANHYLLNMPLHFCIGGEASLVFAGLLISAFCCNHL